VNNEGGDDKDSHFVWDSCEDLTGSYESKTTVNFDVSGLPAEELGYPVGDWDVSITDSITSTGDYSPTADEGEWGHDSSMELGDSSAQKITIDGTEIPVFQTEGTIIPLGFEGLLAVGMEKAIVGSAETVFDSGLLNDTIFDTWSNNLADESNDDHYSGDDGDGPQFNSVDFEADGTDEFRARFYVDALNSGNDYEISWKMKESDGKTVDAGSFVVRNQGYAHACWDDDYCESVSGEIDGWGKYCLEIEVNQIDGDYNPLATDEVCKNLDQQPEPSEKMITMIGAFMQSTVDNTMDSFGQNLENNLDKYEAELAYDSAEMYSLWSKEQGRVVGIQLLVGDSDSGNTFTLVGPESNLYPKAISPINVIYFSGTEAIEQEAEIVDDTTIESLVDLTKHNTAAVDAVAVGQDPTNVDTSDGGNTDAAVAVEAAEEKGLLPFISPVATVAMIALAGIFVAVPRKD
jgi:hypothetical protein